MIFGKIGAAFEQRTPFSTIKAVGNNPNTGHLLVFRADRILCDPSQNCSSCTGLDNQGESLVSSVLNKSSKRRSSLLCVHGNRHHSYDPVPKIFYRAHRNKRSDSRHKPEKRRLLI